MIRIVATACLTALLAAVLYLPSAHPPAHFFQQMLQEHQSTAQIWGFPSAESIAQRALSMQANVASSKPMPLPAAAAATSPERPVGHEMAQVQLRLFGSTYFRSVEALLLLAMYRASAIFEWIPRCIPLALVLVLDGLMLRVVKAKEFRHHNPERFALHVCFGIFTMCASVLVLVWPGPVHPATWAAIPVIVIALGARAVADYHRRP
ncbi:DUF4400 domain-containing protein [Pseudorhodoferax soli]|uniref:Uncharacterized protein DUF4400 n=1 Tax=Pseudorhodoferax soli TaxID=545864 RepID=A0A368XD06_9BURK|nr:DUF4400 domain-containing protein [Pseudorhodoferax soli]RCW65116.1 uncharacterized protein DUF4400 [Pseudorhodoferax soli]